MKRSAQPTDDPSLGSVDPAVQPALAFPDADWDWFVQRCAALGIPGAAERRPALTALHAHLMGVNRWLNLTALTTPRDYLKFHVLDSLALLGDARLKRLAADAPCVDLGSGGGYPGLPLALWWPGVPWVLVDSRRKKVEFLTAAAALLATVAGAGKVSARHLRGGEVGRSPTTADLHRHCQLVVCRAMGQAKEVLVEAAELLRPFGHLVICKGPAFAGDERQAAMLAAPHLGYRLAGERRMHLDDGDPERLAVIFQRLE